LNTTYYITKQIIPSIERVLNLVGADVRSWYHELPTKVRVPRRGSATVGGKTKGGGGGGNQQQQQSLHQQMQMNTIDQYYLTQLCPVCNQLTQKGLCEDCSENKQKSFLILIDKLRKVEMERTHLQEMCASCANVQDVLEIQCGSFDCPVFFERAKTTAKYHSLNETFSECGLSVTNSWE
jgi:DNA polymerase zeta